MYNHATQTSLPFLSDAEKLKELQEENELLRGKIRGYLTLGGLIFIWVLNSLLIVLSPVEFLIRIRYCQNSLSQSWYEQGYVRICQS